MTLGQVIGSYCTEIWLVLMTKDITREILIYREIARMVWNVGYFPNSRLRSWYAVESYDRCMHLLFESMILSLLADPTSNDHSLLGDLRRPIVVKPQYPQVEIRVNQNEESNPSKVWGRPTLLLSTNRHELRFVRFFDWDLLGVRDLALAEVEIVSIATHPDLSGRHGLIPVTSCRFIGELISANPRRKWEEENMPPDPGP